MHTLSDDKRGIVLNHNSDWSGEVRIAWTVNGEPWPEEMSEVVREACWVDGLALLRGAVVLVPKGGALPPIRVQTRAVALAVDHEWQTRIIRAAEQMGIAWGDK